MPIRFSISRLFFTRPHGYLRASKLGTFSELTLYSTDICICVWRIMYRSNCQRNFVTIGENLQLRYVFYRFRPLKKKKRR